VVTCFLLQRMTRKLQAKFGTELSPGTRIAPNYLIFPKFRLVEKDTADSPDLDTIE